MDSEKLLHIKLEPQEIINLKKNILSSEISLIKISKTVGKYKSFRAEELKLKLKLHRKIKDIKTNLNKLEKDLPKIKIPEILEHAHSISTKPLIEKKIEKIETEQHDNDLESQLKGIQERLRELGG